ncbi:hypothetical protein N7513_005421 [Penicillium frequentans]|nr:hypothetical protein N7513_005421 [Penicillium glabrum]
MCMIGLSFFKTEDAVDFIRKIYPGILNEVYAQLIFAAADSQTPADLLNYLVLAHHTLFLFISTGGKLCPEKSRSLYLHATATARQYGFFCSRFDQIYDMLFSPQLEERARWIAWTRAESTKNLIIGLVLHDSWLSELFSMNPIIRTDILILPLPLETTLYQAPTCHKWSQLLTEIPHANQRLELSSHHFHLPDLQGPIHVFSMYGLLCSVLLRVSADTRRLILSSDLVPAEQHHYVPWNICRLDKRASIVSPLLVSLVQLYDTTFRESNPNCIVIWHSVCMLLTADLNLLSRAAGRDGPESMSDARRDLTCWAYTPAARRACIHAAQTFRTLSHRKPADGTAFQSVRTLFMSALILGFYLLGSPANAYLEGPSKRDQFDLANSVVDWKIIGDEGISNDGTPSMAPHDPARLEDAAVRFIRFGGPILIDGKRYEPGPRHAQRILLEFAGLLDEVGTHWMANYARLLYMVHDTMAAPHPRS